MNKRGAFFGFYLVLLTVTMIIIILWLYLVQKGISDSAVVNPAHVIGVRADLEVFEFYEKEVILKTLNEVEKDRVFWSEEPEEREKFEDEFWELFIDKLENEKKEYDGFLFSNLVLGEKDISENAEKNSRAFFTETLYPRKGFDFEEGDLKITRKPLTKKVELKSWNIEKYEKINFPVEFIFEFERIYSVKKVDGEFVVEEFE